MKTLGIYIHIPFCKQKCHYCDFLSFPEGRAQQALYFAALSKEIEIGTEECSDYEVVSIFFGGGTPTSVSADFIVKTMELLKNRYKIRSDAEVTIECNPGTADFESLKLYRESGINRISIGLQSAKDDELRRLGRIHDLKQFEDCYKNARAAGFDNVNVDLMSAIPGQSLTDWENNLNYVCFLSPKPEHISAYSLIIEEGTPFYDMYGDDMDGDSCREPQECISDDMDGNSGREPQESIGNNMDGDSCRNSQRDISDDSCGTMKKILPLPDEDTEREMYHRTREILKQNGYHRYEISNYSLDNRECLHNKRYWQGGDYIGFGLGAASLMDNKRFHNTGDFQKYLSAFEPVKAAGDELNKNNLNDEVKCNGKTIISVIREDEENLDKTAKMEEFMFLGLRMVNGVSKAEFKSRFGENIENIYGNVIDGLVSDGLMETENENIYLTERGLDLSNYCMAKFIFE